MNELWSLANFCVPGRLTSSLEEFRRQFVIPLLNGRNLVQNVKNNLHNNDDDCDSWSYTDYEKNSDDLESPSAKLFRLLNSFFLRRTCDVIAPKLTDKSKYL